MFSARRFAAFLKSPTRKAVCSPLKISSFASEDIHTMSFPPRQLYYDGELHAATSGKTFQTVNPATAAPLADIQVASHGDIDTAIASADRAFRSWSVTPWIARARILHKAALLLRERNDEIARVETLDSGKAFTETSTVDVVTGADVLEYYANFIGGGGLNGETTQLREDAWVYTKKAPLGVCVGIGAWNYPIQMCVVSPHENSPMEAADGRFSYLVPFGNPPPALPLATR